jgi:hypothetical protein
MTRTITSVFLLGSWVIARSSGWVEVDAGINIVAVAGLSTAASTPPAFHFVKRKKESVLMNGVVREKRVRRFTAYHILCPMRGHHTDCSILVLVKDVLL